MSLKQRFIERIRARGPISFAEYMEAALYDPDDGFFARAPVGREFATSAHISPVFGALLARQVQATGLQTVVDLGAGDGMLGRQLKAAIPDLAYIAVERSAAARALLETQGFETAASIEEMKPFEGVVVANELFDNVPFQLLRTRQGRTVEVMIGVKEDDLVEVEATPTIDVPARDDGEFPAPPGAEAMIQEIARVLQRGYAFIIDYGFVAGEPIEPIRGYRAHRTVDDLLAEPGTTDITGPVDFDALAEHARAAGLQTFGPVSQRDALMALRYRDALADMRAQQKRTEEHGDWRAAITTFGARGEASMLVDPSGLGSLKVLALATKGLPRPRSVPVP